VFFFSRYDLSKVKEKEHDLAPPDFNTAPSDIEQVVVAAYEAYAAELFAYATAIIHSEDGALDAVQESFLRYFVELSYGRRVEKPRAWLYRVVRNHLFDRMGSAAVKRETLLPETYDIVGQEPGPEAMMEQAQMAERIESLLTRREMECLRLRSEDLSYEEIARILGVRPGTVSALLTRAHKKLLAPDGDQRTLQRRTVGALQFLFQAGGSSHSS
jgi:RNA polymerase sigma-70 factor (ECF subfamily)